MKKYLMSVAITASLFFLPFFLVIGFFSDDSGGGGFQPKNEQERTALAVLNYIKAHGGTIEFASAWLGNMEHESGLIPSTIQAHRPYDEVIAMNPSMGGYGMGLGQWDMGQRVDLLTLAKKSNKDWKQVQFQMDYAWNHDGSDSTLLKNMSKHKEIDRLAVDILKLWERAVTKDNILEQVKRKASAQFWYKRLTSGGGDDIEGGKIPVLEEILGKTINGGQCYGATAYYVDKMGGPQMMGSGHMYASQIGSDYDWKAYHWTVIQNPKYEDLKAGDVINFGQGGVAISEFGHTGIVASVEGNGSYVTYEQNSEKGQTVEKYLRQWKRDFPVITSLVRKDVSK